jgi:hypothetical protein
MGAALAHRWEPLQGRYPASEVNDGDCPEKPDHLNVGDALTLVKKLISRSQLSDDLLGAVAFAFHGASPGQVWPIGKLS